MVSPEDDSTDRSETRTVPAVWPAATTAKPMNLFPLAAVVAAPLPAVPPTGLPSSSQYTAAPPVKASAALTTSKTPSTARAPSVLAGIGLRVTPTKFPCTTTSPTATSELGV